MAGYGTGGTYAGVGKLLRERSLVISCIVATHICRRIYIYIYVYISMNKYTWFFSNYLCVYLEPI